MTRFMGDYYLEYDSIYYAEYAADEKWEVLPLPKYFPDQWDCGRLADFAEEHNADSRRFGNIAESIRSSLVFRTACFRHLPFVSLPDGAHEMLLSWREKNYKVPLTAQENVLDEFFACDRDDALDVFQDFDCDCDDVISRRSDAALETYSQALQNALGTEAVAQLLQCSEASISKNDLLGALYPFRAHLYRDPGKTAVLELDFTVSAEFPGCIRGTAILEPDCLFAIKTKYIPE